MRTPVATYRVQFNSSFRFADATRVVPYLREIGISDLYASPILRARQGSTHGYDVTDPTQLNPELGPPEDFDELVRTLHAHDMGLIVDIVPNHMAASIENPWWFDVLEKGESSPYAQFFDVNWDSKKVLLPILGKPYGEALENDELKLRVENGRVVLQYLEQKLPIAAGAESLNLDAVDRVLARQHYRLAFWRKAADSINYRRFFDVSDLIGLRTERDDVFEATHTFLCRLIEDGRVTGLRIDHIDGLIDPQSYLQRLPRIYLVAEKILSGDETLVRDWQVAGTTGYDFLNSVNAVFVDPAGFEKVKQYYAEFVGSTEPLADVVLQRKRQVMNDLFSAEVNSFVKRLAQLAENDRHARDLTMGDLRDAFIEVTAWLRVYRTYVRDSSMSETDRAQIEDAISLASRSKESAAYPFIRRVLLLEPAWYLKDEYPQYLDFVMRWQQFSGPIMAKGLEDTAFYVYNPLVSVNEVGGDPAGPERHFGVEEFHRRNLVRMAGWPRTMNATSTHDTKRSEDARIRINVISELAEVWARNLKRWDRMHAGVTAPDRNEQVMIYQNLLGAWPIDKERLKRFVTKGLREAKTHSSWMHVNEGYEKRVMRFVDDLLASEPFMRSFLRFQKKVARLGALYSLSQVLLKITAPGIPDFYQGNETWDFSLADPDNRHPVDFEAHSKMLNTLKSDVRPQRLLKNWTDGKIKLFVTQQALKYRQSHSSLFLLGEYIPIKVHGLRQDHVIAFGRRYEDEWTVLAVPRLIAKVPLSSRGDTGIDFPQNAPQNWINVLTGETPDFNSFPYMLLTPQ